MKSTDTVTLTTTASTHPGSLLRSTAAVLLGFVAVVVLSLGTDQVLHVLELYPPWGQPMHDAGLNLLALSYRSVYAVVGSYIAARFAPRNPMRHAMVLGLIGFALSAAGAIAAIRMDLGPPLVSDRARAHCVALCLARRSFTPLPRSA